jgi:hypothetical protein
MGFEPTIPVFQRARTVHTLDLAATVIGTDVVRINELTLLVSLGLMREKSITFIFMGFCVLQVQSSEEPVLLPY